VKGTKGVIMGNRRKWYSILLIGLVLLLATSVIGCPAPIPTPTQPAAPLIIVAFSATPTQISAGESATLQWNVTGATTVNIDHGIGDVPSAGTKLVSPTTTTTYTLTATNVADRATDRVTLAVVSALPKVTRVIDGDTIEVDIGGKLYKVRYIGIDTPETVHPSKPVECFGKEASEKNRQLVEGKTVRLEKDVSETDSYGRLLRYVWVGDNFVNDYLVRQGYAYAYTYPPDVKYAEQFVQAQREARENNRGLWVACQETTIQPPPSQPPLPPPTSAISLAIISVKSPVSPGAYATLKAQATPGAQCTITVYYKSGPSKAQGLYSKQADSNGDVSWTWKVGTRTTPGSWRIVVTATYGGKTVSQETSFTVR
jgi:micrococcal nuclease